MVVVGADDAKGLQNNLDINADWGRSDLDIRHRFVFSPVYEIGRCRKTMRLRRHVLSNWTFSGIITLQSGFAYSALIAGDANRDGNPSTDRVPGTERNGFTTPSIYIFDTRVTKTFKFGENYSLSFLAEAFNLFNRSNIATVNTGSLRDREFVGDGVDESGGVDAVWWAKDFPRRAADSVRRAV